MNVIVPIFFFFVLMFSCFETYVQNSNVYHLDGDFPHLSLELSFYFLTVMQNNEKKDFVVGDELLVKCSSFTGKGIPVVSLVDS